MTNSTPTPNDLWKILIDTSQSMHKRKQAFDSLSSQDKDFLSLKEETVLWNCIKADEYEAFIQECFCCLKKKGFFKQ